MLTVAALALACESFLAHPIVLYRMSSVPLAELRNARDSLNIDRSRRGTIAFPRAERLAQLEKISKLEHSDVHLAMGQLMNQGLTLPLSQDLAQSAGQRGTVYPVIGQAIFSPPRLFPAAGQPSINLLSVQHFGGEKRTDFVDVRAALPSTESPYFEMGAKHDLSRQTTEWYLVTGQATSSTTFYRIADLTQFAKAAKPWVTKLRRFDIEKAVAQAQESFSIESDGAYLSSSSARDQIQKEWLRELIRLTDLKADPVMETVHEVSSYAAVIHQALMSLSGNKASIDRDCSAIESAITTLRYNSPLRPGHFDSDQFNNPKWLHAFRLLEYRVAQSLAAAPADSALLTNPAAQEAVRRLMDYLYTVQAATKRK